MNLLPPHGGPSGSMHPNDMRNMLIFVVVAIVLWFSFDHFLLQPQMKALKAQQQVEAQQKLANIKNAINAPPAPIAREEALTKTTRIKIETDTISGSLSTQGARLDDLQLKKFFTEIDKKHNVVLLSPAGTENANYAETGWLASDNSIKVPDRNTIWSVKGSDILTPTTPVTLTWSNGAGLEFERVISIDKNYMFQITQKVTNNSGKAITLFPYASVTRHGIPQHATTVGYEGPFGFINEEAHKISYNNILKDQQTNITGTGGWIGFTDKYWLTAIVPNQKVIQDFRFSSQKADPEQKSVFQVDVRGQAMKIASGASAEMTDHIFSGAKIVSLLNDYETSLSVKHFDLAVDFGALYFLTRPMYFILNLLNGWFGNFGLAIIGLTLVVRAAVFPLANKSYRSFAGLKKVAPKMTELRVKYGDDKAKLQQELIKLYETEKVNPMAGCFPLLLQIPIFFAVYKVISISIEMRHAPFFGWIQDLSAKDPLTIFNGFGLLPFDVWSFLHIGPWSVAMLILMLIQKSMNPPPTDQIQKDIANFMPWVITFVMAKFPVGLVIYWTFSNLLSVIQQYVIMRSMGVPVYLFAKDEALAYEQSHAKKIEEAKSLAEKEREDKKKTIEDKKEKLKEELSAKKDDKKDTPQEEAEVEHLFGSPKDVKDDEKK